MTPVLSGSMRPGFAVGGVVISERVPTADLAVRDVIIFNNPSRPGHQTVRRIISLDVNPNGRTIRTQGDANSSPDPWVLTTSDSHVYRVRYSLPLLGYAAMHVNRTTALMVACALMAVACLSALVSRPADREATPEVAVETRT